jgi:hypothetical protein
MANFVNASNSGEHGFYVQRGSTLSAIESILDGSAIGTEVTDTSSAVVSVSSIKNCTTALIVSFASNLSADVCDVSGAVNIANIFNSSIVSMKGTNVDGAATGVIVSGSSSVHMADSIITNTLGDTLSVSNSIVNAEFCIFTGSALLGIRAQSGSAVNAYKADVSNSGESGFYTSSSSINAIEGVANDCIENGVYVVKGGSVAFSDGSAQRNKRGFRVENGSVTADDSNLSGNSITGVYAAAAHINLKGANTRKGASDSTDDIGCFAGSVLQASNAIGGSNVTDNTVTSSGILFR